MALLNGKKLKTQEPLSPRKLESREAKQNSNSKPNGARRKEPSELRSIIEVREPAKSGKPKRSKARKHIQKTIRKTRKPRKQHVLTEVVNFAGRKCNCCSPNFMAFPCPCFTKSAENSRHQQPSQLMPSLNSLSSWLRA